MLNDHLGDGYWRVGREREARFQWEQALTLQPEPEDAEKIRASWRRACRRRPQARQAKRTQAGADAGTRQDSARAKPSIPSFQ